MPPTNTWLNYGPLCSQLKLTNSSLNTTLLGSLLLRGQLGGVDGGRGWSGPRNAAYAKYRLRFQVPEGLNTILVAIESTINSRPIVQAEEESGALTPAHFLIGERLTAIPTGPEPETSGSLTKEFRMRQKLADDFWRRWQRENLTTSRNFHEVRQQQASTRLRRGDVALLQEYVRPFT